MWLIENINSILKFLFWSNYGTFLCASAAISPYLLSLRYRFYITLRWVINVEWFCVRFFLNVKHINRAHYACAKKTLKCHSFAIPFLMHVYVRLQHFECVHMCISVSMLDALVYVRHIFFQSTMQHLFILFIMAFCLWNVNKHLWVP